MNSKLFFGLLIVSLMMVSLLMGCSGSSNSSYIELNDPGAGMVGTVVVGSDGVFKGEFKNGKSVGNLDGRVTSAGKGPTAYASVTSGKLTQRTRHLSQIKSNAN